MPTRLLAHPADRSRAGEPAAEPLPFSDKPFADPVALAIGPEGGFTDEEATLATTAGWTLVDLGPRILRVETAAILLLALVMQRRSS
jgi:16S rRNA (uracil1498-N3)-methyltransferase